jgi:hypothetical protein
MASITISLLEEGLLRLKAIAKEVGVSPEELARASLEEWLNRPREDFERAASYVLSKNEDLYKRLA